MMDFFKALDTGVGRGGGGVIGALFSRGILCVEKLILSWEHIRFIFLGF